jgi:hypothetical protein
MLLQFFKAMQPGFFMFSGQDLAGALPLPPPLSPREAVFRAKKLLPMGAFPLLSNAESHLAGSLGLPRTHSLYGPLDAQLNDPGSVFNEMAEMLRLRADLGVDQGRLIGRLHSAGSGLAVLAVLLPERREASRSGPTFALSICNFSRETREETLDLSSLPEMRELAEKASVSMLYGDAGAIRKQGNRLAFVAPRWSRALLLLEASGKAE